MSWVNTSEAKQRIAAAKAHAISEFKKHFPNADISRFQVEVEADANRKATGTVLFTESDGFTDEPTNQILVARSAGCFRVSSRRWFSCSAIAAYRKQAPASSSS